MSRIDQMFARCEAERRAAFIPFLMAGDPSLQMSGRLLRALAAGGADLIEVGVPFSDPIADGPVNQRAAGRALAAGASLPGVLRLVAEEREAVPCPIVLFSYFNPLYHYGLERFAEHAAASGVDGVLCVDLPPEEAESEWIPALRRARIDTVFLAAPTSPPERMRRICSASRGFVYFVSRTGVTGERQSLEKDLARQLKRLRKQCSLPVSVGFGIATPAQAEEVAGLADGVVVGSALVRLVEEAGESEDLPARVQNRVAQFVGGLGRRRSGWSRLLGRG